MRKNLLDLISVFLLKKGHTVKIMKSGCFDILARKDNILLIKVLSDANSVSQEATLEMKKIASYIKAVAMIIADKAGKNLADNVVYARFGIYTLNFPTFANCIRQKLPIIKSTQAGYTACLCGSKLRQKREEIGYSLNDLAHKVGVSSRMISKYEGEESEITIKKAFKLFGVFGEDIFKQIEIFDTLYQPIIQGKSEISKKYTELGFDASELVKAPFDVIAKKENEIILTEVGDKTNPNLVPWARLLEVNKLVIFKKRKPKHIPAVSKEEFLEFEKSKELIDYLKEF